jgi:hypothetical protein
LQANIFLNSQPSPTDNPLKPAKQNQLPVRTAIKPVQRKWNNMNNEESKNSVQRMHMKLGTTGCRPQHY